MMNAAQRQVALTLWEARIQNIGAARSKSGISVEHHGVLMQAGVNVALPRGNASSPNFLSAGGDPGVSVGGVRSQSCRLCECGGRLRRGSRTSRHVRLLVTTRKSARCAPNIRGTWNSHEGGESGSEGPRFSRTSVEDALGHAMLVGRVSEGIRGRSPGRRTMWEDASSRPCFPALRRKAQRASRTTKNGRRKSRFRGVVSIGPGSDRRSVWGACGVGGAHICVQYGRRHRLSL